MATEKGSIRAWKLATVVLLIGFGLAAGGFASSVLKGPASPASAKVLAPSNTAVALAVIPDYGGNGYDAFVPVANFNGTVPAQSANGAGPSYNTVTVPLNTSVKFVIVNTDTAVNENFTGKAPIPMAIYNDTNSGQVAVQYATGQQISNLQVGHSFDIPQLNVNVPIPPDTVVTFNYTFTSPGTYEYLCLIPCGPGMGLTGYMNGYIVVTS